MASFLSTVVKVIKCFLISKHVKNNGNTSKKTDSCVSIADHTRVQKQLKVDLFGEQNIKVSMKFGSTFAFVYSEMMYPKFETNEVRVNG